MLLWICQGNLHKIKKEHSISHVECCQMNWYHLNHCWVRWFFYFKITNSNTISKRIMIIKEKIKKSFFDILSPPLYEEKRHHPTIKCSKNTLSNICSLCNSFILNYCQFRKYTSILSKNNILFHIEIIKLYNNLNVREAK